MKKCGKVKNPCRICLQSVTAKNGLRCMGACQKWAHFKCLEYTPGKILDIKAGLIRVNCPCPDCHAGPKEEYLNKPYICGKEKCPANLPLKCDIPSCPINNPSDWTQTEHDCPADSPSISSINQKKSPINQKKSPINQKKEEECFPTKEDMCSRFTYPKITEEGLVRCAPETCRVQPEPVIYVPPSCPPPPCPPPPCPPPPCPAAPCFPPPCPPNPPKCPAMPLPPRPKKQPKPRSPPCPPQLPPCPPKFPQQPFKTSRPPCPPYPPYPPFRNRNIKDRPPRSPPQCASSSQLCYPVCSPPRSPSPPRSCASTPPHISPVHSQTDGCFEKKSAPSPPCMAHPNAYCSKCCKKILLISCSGHSKQAHEQNAIKSRSCCEVLQNADILKGNMACSTSISDSEIRASHTRSRLSCRIDQICNTIGEFSDQFRELMCKVMTALEKCR